MAGKHASKVGRTAEEKVPKAKIWNVKKNPLTLLVDGKCKRRRATHKHARRIGKGRI